MWSTVSMEFHSPTEQTKQGPQSIVSASLICFSACKQDSNGDDSPAPTSSAPQEPSDSKAGATPQDTPQLSRLPSLPARKERALHSGQTLDSEAPKAATASEEVAASDVSKPVQGRKDSVSGAQNAGTEAACKQSSSNIDTADSKESQSTAEAGSQEPKTKAGGRQDKPVFGRPVQEGPTAEETKNSQVQVSEADPASSSQTGSGRGKGSEENEEQGGEEDEEQGPGAHKDEGGDEEGALRKPATGQEEDEGPEATGELCSCANLQLTTQTVQGACVLHAFLLHLIRK